MYGLMGRVDVILIEYKLYNKDEGSFCSAGQEYTDPMAAPALLHTHVSSV